MTLGVPEKLETKLALIADRVGTEPDKLWFWVEQTADKLDISLEDALESALSLGQLRSKHGHVFQIKPNFTRDKWAFSLATGETTALAYEEIFSQEGFADANEALEVIARIIRVIKHDDYDIAIWRDGPIGEKKPEAQTQDRGFDNQDSDVPF
jgi:hypothetical protein